MIRFKYLWWKFWAWLTKPWAPKDKIGNPRDKKRRGDPAWMVFSTNGMRVVNAVMMTVIIVSLMLLYAVNK